MESPDEPEPSGGASSEGQAAKSRARQRMRARLFMMVLLGVVIALVWTFVPKYPALVTWTSPPLDASGLRVSCLLPYGWKQDLVIDGVVLLLSKNGFYGYHAGADSGHIYGAAPPKGEQTLIEKLLTRVFGPRDRGGITVFAGEQDLSDLRNHEYDRRPAIRVIQLPGSDFQAEITYWRADKGTFDRTRDTVLNSLRFVR